MGQRNFLSSAGFDPTTSGLNLPMLYQLSYESSTGASLRVIEIVNRGKCVNDIDKEPRSTCETEMTIFIKLLSFLRRC